MSARGLPSTGQLTISAVTKMLILVEVGTSSITIEKVSQRLASANHEKTRLNRLYWSSAGARIVSGLAHKSLDMEEEHPVDQL